MQQALLGLFIVSHKPKLHSNVYMTRCTNNTQYDFNYIDCIVQAPYMQAFGHGNTASYTTDIGSR
jgi:hypothetical protein